MSSPWFRNTRFTPEEHVHAAMRVMKAGEGALAFELDGHRTSITTARASAPLKLLSPRNHGSARWTFMATYGGGLVDGDAVTLDVRVGDGAKALLGTQASTKVYRGASRQTFVADVGDDALLVVMPDPLAPFAGARYEQRATLRLAPRARLVWVDSLSCGRAARGERWAFSRYASRTRLLVGGALVADDALVLMRRSRISLARWVASRPTRPCCSSAPTFTFLRPRRAT